MDKNVQNSAKHIVLLETEQFFQQMVKFIHLSLTYL